nr:hypothetical protein HJG63_008304 [Rousettus aegyptiacus]
MAVTPVPTAEGKSQENLMMRQVFRAVGGTWQGLNEDFRGVSRERGQQARRDFERLRLGTQTASCTPAPAPASLGPGAETAPVPGRLRDSLFPQGCPHHEAPWRCSLEGTSVPCSPKKPSCNNSLSLVEEPHEPPVFFLSVLYF